MTNHRAFVCQRHIFHVLISFAVLAIDCGQPEQDQSNAVGGQVVLLNVTTTYLSLAQLRCPYGKIAVGGNTIIHWWDVDWLFRQLTSLLTVAAMALGVH